MSVYLNDAIYERFFRGFMATLFVQGERFISTQDDEHQQKFDRVVQSYREYRRLASAGDLANFPAFFSKSKITGRYKELDDALLQLQQGLLGAQNPYYTSVKFGCSEVVAESVLNSYSEAEKQLLARLASTYREGFQEDCALAA